MKLQTLISSYICIFKYIQSISDRVPSSRDSHSAANLLKEINGFDEKESELISNGINLLNNKSRVSLSKEEHSASIANFADIVVHRSDYTFNSGCADSDIIRSIFCNMNCRNGDFYLNPKNDFSSLHMPVSEHIECTEEIYNKALSKFLRQTKDKELSASEINKLLSIAENCFSLLPSVQSSDFNADISIYDEIKITAAVAACVSEYLIDTDKTCDELLNDESSFDSEFFMLYSADLSGIQQFIYTVGQSGAMRSLRSRSFFLSLFMEHYLDEILEGCGLGRANLLYSGGGHCYMLLPNTQKTKDVLAQLNSKFNDFLVDSFGSSLFLAHGFTQCCANDLVNIPACDAPYKAMFKRVSNAVAAHKMNRYSYEQLLRLNNECADSTRECKVCGRADFLEQDDTCNWCHCFAALSQKIQRKSVYVVSSQKISEPDFTLPALNGEVYFYFTDENEAKSLLSENSCIKRTYVKNKPDNKLSGSINIYVGDYSSDNQVLALSQKSTGIQRIAVCRMDVDNLGRAFVKGFEDTSTDDPKLRYRFVTLTRTSSFSRNISLFFQLYINDILSGKFENKKPLNVTVVYSGGDDVFLIGSWNDVLEAANRIENSFSAYTCGSLSLSGGFGLFDDKFPVREASRLSADLEDKAKHEEGKNSVCLFEPTDNHTYSWKTFREKVLDEKLSLIASFFGKSGERGNTALYKIVTLLRTCEDEGGRINIARLAYQLARLEPKRRDPIYPIYEEFSQKVYKWSLNKTDRKQLITAIYLYVYQNRKV